MPAKAKLNWKLVLLSILLFILSLFLSAVVVGTFAYAVFPLPPLSLPTKVVGYGCAALFLFLIGRYALRPRVSLTAPHDALAATIIYTGISASQREGDVNTQLVGFIGDLLLGCVLFAALRNKDRPAA